MILIVTVNGLFGSLATEAFRASADQCPLLVQKRTFAGTAELSAKCQKQTLAAFNARRQNYAK